MATSLVEGSWGSPEPALSILSTSPTNSPQHVQARNPCANIDVYPAQLFASPQMQQALIHPGHKPVGEQVRQGGGVGGGKQQRGSGQGRGTAKPSAQAPRNYMKNNEITHQPPPWTDVTTVMMRNLPNKYSQHMLLEELKANKFRLQHEFDFFYLPMDHYSAVNLGYCFINFVETHTANAFAAAFQGRRMRMFNSQKTIVVMPASMQGFEKNYAYYSSTRVAQAEDPQYRPIFTRPAPGTEVASFQPCTTVLWTPSTPYGQWAMPASMPYPQVPCITALQQQDFSTDDEQEYGCAVPDGTFCDRSMEVFGSSNIQDNCSDPRAVGEQEEEEEDVRISSSQRLLIRNTFFAVPERSPSVERCLQRQCKSCPVSAPNSAAGSARIELVGAPKAAGLDFAVVAAASCLAMDLGCVAVQDLPGTSSGSGSMLSVGVRSCAGSTTAESERDGHLTMQQQGSGSFCGSDLPSETSHSEHDAVVLGSPQFPCKGSALHKMGTCKPCAFHCSGGPEACKNGIECTFCHLCEPGEKKRRKKEKQATKREHRDKIRQSKRDPAPIRQQW